MAWLADSSSKCTVYSSQELNHIQISIWNKSNLFGKQKQDTNITVHSKNMPRLTLTRPYIYVKNNIICEKYSVGYRSYSC